MTLGKTLAETLNLSGTEVDLWAIYFKENPQGEERADNRAGLIAATIANTAANRKRGAKVFSYDDFVLKYGSKPKQSAEQMQAIAKSLSPAKKKKKKKKN